MKQIRVVTSFLMNDDKILILRRSDKVRTMQNRWAGISGYIEGDENVLERAYREISEETGLNTNAIELVKAGEPLKIADKELDILWIVYPHLFRTSRTDIKLNWEHDQYCWIKSDEIVNYETVPMLKETLARVLM
ncbi:MAG: NUDIX pyrophosphatase [Nitrososphaerales archaeon]